MESLLINQKTEIDELNRLIKNYRADGPTRKTERYLNDKIATFGELFRTIENNEKDIQEIRSPRHDNQPYFANNTFVAIKLAYETILTDISTRLNAIKGASIGAATSSTKNGPNPTLITKQKSGLTDRSSDGNNSDGDDSQPEKEETEANDNLNDLHNTNGAQNNGDGADAAKMVAS